MSDFEFLKIPNFPLWTIQAPKRAKRPYSKGRKCPFCPGNEGEDNEIYRIGGEKNDSKWLVRVIENKYPFAPIHEVVVLTPQHTKHLSDASV